MHKNENDNFISDLLLECLIQIHNLCYHKLFDNTKKINLEFKLSSLNYIFMTYKTT